MGKVLRQATIRREDLQDNPNVLYAFGDNMIRSGYGGQAAEMRGEPNAVGIPTKHFPHNGKHAFFTDDDLENEKVMIAIALAFSRLRMHVIDGGTVVFPSAGVGTGRADLIHRAPKMYEFLQGMVSGVEANARESQS